VKMWTWLKNKQNVVQPHKDSTYQTFLHNMDIAFHSVLFALNQHTTTT